MASVGPEWMRTLVSTQVVLSSALTRQSWRRLGTNGRCKSMSVRSRPGSTRCMQPWTCNIVRRRINLELKLKVCRLDHVYIVRQMPVSILAVRPCSVPAFAAESDVLGRAMTMMFSALLRAPSAQGLAILRRGWPVQSMPQEKPKTS